MDENKCLSCDKTTLGWYCPEHYLRKEAVYGHHDLLYNTDFKDEETKEYFQKWGIRRLCEYAIFMLKKGT